jgi:hypothetical protein
MAKQTSLGAVYAISAAEPATYDSVGFAALTWTDVEGVTNIGDFGPTFEDVTDQPLKTGITEHRKGGADYGEFAPVMSYDQADAGQTLFLDGVDGTNKDVVYSHRVTLQDGTIFYVTGQIFAAPLSVGDASSMVSITGNVKLNNKPVVV